MTDAAEHLSPHHRTTLEQIGRHPTTHNLEWHDVVGLVEEVAEVTVEHDGKLVVELDGQRLVLSRPRHKDVDEEMVVDLRRFFTAAGLLPTAHG